MKHYSLKNILQQNALYNVIFGERFNGKTIEQKRKKLQEKRKEAEEAYNAYIEELKKGN